jgi:hypothetical protein
VSKLYAMLFMTFRTLDTPALSRPRYRGGTAPPELTCQGHYTRVAAGVCLAGTDRQRA